MQNIADRADAEGIIPVVIIPPLLAGDPATEQIYANPLTHPDNILIDEYRQVIQTQVMSQGSNIQIAANLFGFYSMSTASTPSRSSLFMHNMHPNALAYHINSELIENGLAGGTNVPYLLEDLQPVSRLYKQNLLEVGDEYYMDQAYTVGSIPSILDGGIWVMTPNADRSSTSQSVIFDVGSTPVTVYVAYDSGTVTEGPPGVFTATGPEPAWLSSNFTLTGEQVTVFDQNQAPLSPLNIYSQSGVTGTVTLGGNLAGGLPLGPNNYTVIVVK
jgi:hypothetical protein